MARTKLRTNETFVADRDHRTDPGSPGAGDHLGLVIGVLGRVQVHVTVNQHQL